MTQFADGSEDDTAARGPGAPEGSPRGGAVYGSPRHSEPGSSHGEDQPTGQFPAHPYSPRPGQPYPVQPYQDQPYPDQPHPTQQYPGQQYPGQQYPGQQDAGQRYPARPYPAAPRPSGLPDPTRQYPAGRFDRGYGDRGYGGRSGYPGPPGSDGAPEGGPAPRRRVNARVLTAVAVSVALVIGLVTLGWALVSPDPVPAAAGVDPTTEDPSGSATTSGPAPTPTPTATPKPTPKKTTAKPRVTPTKKPPAAQLPPPPPPPTSDSPSCTKYVGTKATADQVRAALLDAGGRDYWAGASPPSGATEPLPTINVPAALMKAEAFTESSWVSNVISCDGGIGTMQVMPGTASWMNGRFGTNYDVNTLSGNTRLGAEYLEWLTVYFGLYYFGSYDLSATAPVGTGGTTMKLRDVVIAAYNVGPTNVENDNGTPDDGSDDTLSIPNQWYVDRVVGYMANCPCDQL